MIGALPRLADLTLDDEDAVNEAYAKYQKLTPSQKGLIDPAEFARLEDALDRITQLKEEKPKPMSVSGTAAYTRAASAGAFTLNVKTSVSGASLAYRSSNTRVVTVNANGIVTPLAAGTAKITVTALKSGYTVATMTVTVKVTGLAKGKSGVFGSGASKATYEITGVNTATYVKCKAASKAKTLSVPAAVTINGASYKVTAVAASAMSGRSKATKITVGANVVTIGAKAFNKCSRASRITISSNVLTGIGASAFNGCKKFRTLTIKSSKLITGKCRKCLKGSSVTTVKVPKAKKKAYKAIFKKSVCGKNVKLK